MIWLELILFLSCIVIGSRIGGVGMGTMGGLGLLVFVFIFRLPPGGPPVVVLGMILAVITALAAMEAAGGINYLVGVAERIMRKRPQSITFVAPFVTYALIFLAGTQHVIYALLPIISEISRKSNIPPQRPLSITIIAAMQGLIASPISAAMVALVGLLSDDGVTIPQVLMVVVPSTLISIGAGALTVARRGKPLDQDPEYHPEEEHVASAETSNELTSQQLKRAKGSTLLFFATVVFIVLLGLFPGLRPTPSMIADTESAESLDMAKTIMIIMIATAGLIMIFFKAGAKETVGGAMMRSGIVAIISIMGISWMGSSFFEGNKPVIVEGIASIIRGNEWLFGLGLFALSMMLFSQAATIVTLIPVAIGLHIPTPLIIALYPAVNSLFFLPTYGTILAAVSFDHTGSTKIGKYLLNHSFMVPGLVTVVTSVLVSLLLTYTIL